MSDLDVLRQLEGRLTPPPYDALAAVARSRRRRSAVVAAAATVAAVLAAVGIGVALSGEQRAQGPIDRPSPTDSRSPRAWTPDRIRSLGTVGETMPATDSGLAASQYSVCDAPPCGNTPPPGAIHSAVEVTQDGRSAVFDLHYERYPWFRAFDQDTVLVVDSDASTGFRRYRLLKANGSEVSLRVNADPAPAVPGPGVVAIPMSSTLDGWDRLYVVDDTARTLTPLAVPKGIRSWGPNPDTFLWGVAGDCRVFLSTARSHEFRRLNCSDTFDSTSVAATDELPVGWLRPGRMVVEEQFGTGNQTAIHVSLDSGATWQRFVLAGNDSIASVLRSIGP